MSSSETNCQPYPDFPWKIEGAMGGLVADQYAVTCGGYYYGDYFDDCVVMNSDESFKMIGGRAFAASVTLPNSNLWITGGKGGEFGSEVSSSEIISGLEATQGPELPVSVAYHCMTMRNEHEVLIIGGYIEEDQEFSGRTFSFDLRSNTWTELGTSPVARGYAGCGSFYSSYFQENILLTYGGWDGGRQIYSDVEALLEGYDDWAPAGGLPFNWFQMASMTNTNKDGLLVVGGYSKGIGEVPYLYEVTFPESGMIWRRLDQALQVPRAKHVAFLIYENMADCTQNRNSTLV